MTASSTTRQGNGGQSVSAVHAQIRDAILHGEVEAGATIPQHALADMFDTGRTPLREALRLLQREGLVISEANRPVRIAELSASNFEQLYLMRIALEAVAIRITIPTLTSDDLAELEACMAKMDHYQKVGDQAGLRTPHAIFHRTLVAGAGADTTAKIGELADHAERYRLSFGGFGAFADRRAEHRAILTAVQEGQADVAAEKLVTHYADTAEIVFGRLDPDYDLSRLRLTIRTVAPGAEPALS